MLSQLICLIDGAGYLVGGGDCWDCGDDQASQVQSLFLRYWAAFKIPEHEGSSAMTSYQPNRDLLPNNIMYYIVKIIMESIAI